jgi:hypothetical protein
MCYEHSIFTIKSVFFQAFFYRIENDCDFRLTRFSIGPLSMSHEKSSVSFIDNIVDNQEGLYCSFSNRNDSNP